MEQSKDELWPYFTDTDILTECAPGCKEMTLISPHEIEAVMAVGVGSVKPEFDVDVVVTRADRPDVLEMKAVGHAPRNEFETVAEMELKENASGGTTVVWSATADVSGTIASLGGPRAQERHQTAGQEILLEDAGESRRGRRGRVRTRGRARARRHARDGRLVAQFSADRGPGFVSARSMVFRSVRCVLARVSSADCRSTSVFSGRPFAQVVEKTSTRHLGQHCRCSGQHCRSVRRVRERSVRRVRTEQRTNGSGDAESATARTRGASSGGGPGRPGSDSRVPRPRADRGPR